MIIIDQNNQMFILLSLKQFIWSIGTSITLSFEKKNIYLMRQWVSNTECNLHFLFRQHLEGDLSPDWNVGIMQFYQIVLDVRDLTQGYNNK